MDHGLPATRFAPWPDPCQTIVIAGGCPMKFARITELVQEKPLLVQL